MICKVKDFLKSVTFVAAFLFIGSGLFEAMVLKLLEAMGL